ncbi:hypothetical protein DPEC_G00168820 [Dallia pectoralis]|uniref:Uncharacterized protein n=1 Tax=Dallia pectoralis TaxID=75939 RepID=A0ACC2GCX3_DALPE|nr:hypothetical protein DPEC_G00168820 [Dallia pectoralis]
MEDTNVNQLLQEGRCQLITEKSEEQEVYPCAQYQLITEKKSLCHEDQPRVRYQLITEKKSLDQEDQIRRCTFGKKNPMKVNKTILMVGETGTGKSTLINAMVNYVLGVKLEDKVWFQIVEQEERQQTTKSQTTGVTVCEVFGSEGGRVPYSLTIIDTPGFGDTKGKENDKVIADKLLQLFSSENGIFLIDAVCLVVKATMNRLSDRQLYIFDAVLSLFGKDIEKNIMVLLTYFDGTPPYNVLEAITAAKVPCAKNKDNQPVHFVINNCQCEHFNEEYQTRSDYDHLQEKTWNQGIKALERFFTYLNDIETKNLRMTEGGLKAHKQLEATVINLRERVQLMEGKQKEIKDTQQILEKKKKDMKENKDFTYKGEETYKDTETVDTSWIWFLYNSGATICTVCEENCHYPGCWLVRDLSWCSVMKNNYCTVCTNKCHYTNHVKGNKRYVVKTRMVTKTYEQLKKKYEQYVGEKGKVLSRLQEELEEITQKKTSLVEEAYQCVIKLEEIALKTISLATAQHLDFLIEKMKEMGETEKVKKLEKMKEMGDTEKVKKR